MVSIVVPQPREDQLAKIEKEELTWPFLPLASLLKIYETSSYNFPVFPPAESSSVSPLLVQSKVTGGAHVASEAIQVETTAETKNRKTPHFIFPTTQMNSNLNDSSSSNLTDSSNLNLEPLLGATKDEPLLVATKDEEKEKEKEKEKKKNTFAPEEQHYPSNAYLRTILHHLELILVVHQTLKPLLSPLVAKKEEHVSFLDLLGKLIKEKDSTSTSSSEQTQSETQSAQSAQSAQSVSVSREKELKNKKKKQKMSNWEAGAILASVRQNETQKTDSRTVELLSSAKALPFPISPEWKSEPEKKRRRHDIPATSQVKRNLFSADFGTGIQTKQNKKNCSKKVKS